ncbi:DNA recombination protein RmuC [Terriglobus tenax]|uniref:DNA recombination protein RmuC n=1 Tax=Terriglobus tenax TaxID=1111115 RepID=UPI0021E0344E|nr:DNA recombination protein RmuC [Terriglobus tenax]
MLIALAALNGLTLILVIAVLLRKQAPPIDPEQLRRLEARSEALEAALRTGFADARRETAEAALRSIETQAKAAAELRTEVMGSIMQMGDRLSTGLDSFRSDNKQSAAGLEHAMKVQMDFLQNRLGQFAQTQNDQATSLRESLNSKLNDLTQNNTQSLERLNRDNAAKLEEMRQTVDEKLHATLQTRLTESFGQVTTHLGEVQKGLGEMKELATGVSDLKKVFSNVKSRGVVGEFQLGMQLEQMFSPEQYVKNARIKKGSLETVEYALKFPNGAEGEVLLPIDAKFPREDWERLEAAYEHGTPEEIAKAGTAFERAIRIEGQRICDKYIEEPVTLPHAIMFLPTESLYAEVVRRPGLQTEVQQKCRVTIAGPSTFMAILTSFQMGFHTLALEKKGSEVWKVLSNVKTEFGKFEVLMTKVEDNVGRVQKTLGEIGTRTRAINRNLRGVTELPSGDNQMPPVSFEEIAGVAPLLAASEEEPF